MESAGVHQSKAVVAFLFFCALTTGCCDARYVRIDPNSAIVAIPKNTNDWPTHYRDKAEELMRAKFPQGYVIDEEMEVAKGTHTEVREEADTSSVAAVILRKKNTVQNDTPLCEWRIFFHGVTDKPSPGIPVVIERGTP